MVLGEITRGRTIGPAEPLGFRAFASSFSAVRVGTRLKPGSAACTMCGLVWTQLEPLELLNQLGSLPSGDVKRWLNSPNDTPL